jgi:CTP:molybdopterin cytidylyltransferase MocA
MPGPLVVIFHQPPRPGDAPLTRLLAQARGLLVDHQARLFENAGAARVLVLPGREDARPSAGARAESFGERLARLVTEERITGGVVVLGSGAVPLLGPADARRLVDAASNPERRALTNNRYSSDICAISDARVLLDLPPLPSDNALPRWLEERGGVPVAELPGRDRLAIDLDTPLDLALLVLTRRPPREVAAIAAEHRLAVPRLEELRALAADPRRELLVFGRTGSGTLRWLERNVRCRVRFLAEERGMRASSPLAIGDASSGDGRAGRPRLPRATLGRLLEARGPGGLEQTVAELGDGAVLDSRVLLADRLGADEDRWPYPEDRFASDLLRPDGIADPWLQALTAAAAGARIPILLGAHTLVGPGIPVLLRGVRPPSTTARRGP